MHLSLCLSLSLFLSRSLKAHGVISPNEMLRVGRHKLIYSHGDPAALFDVVSDPDELHDLAGDSAHAGTLCAFEVRF